MINEEKSKYGYGEYPHRLFHRKKGDLSTNVNDILNEKLKESTDENQNFIFEKIKLLSEGKIELNNPTSGARAPLSSELRPAPKQTNNNGGGCC